MAHRIHRLYKTIDTEEVQGEGSFVKIKNMTIAEILDFADVNKTGGNLSEDEAKNMGMLILNRMIVDWNWVDDDDNPLPIPAKKPGTLESLPFQEATYLITKTGIKDLLDTKN